MTAMRQARLPILVGTIALAAFVACDSLNQSLPSAKGRCQPELQAGEAKFNANCSACHGQQGKGRR